MPTVAKKCKLENVEDENLEELKTQCSNVHKNVANKLLERLPFTERETVTACFQAAFCHSNIWAFECLLFHMKYPKTYTCLRNMSKFLFPRVDTLQKHLQGIQSFFGFKAEALDELQSKMMKGKNAETRGTIIC